jgi:hypothetical protein
MPGQRARPKHKRVHRGYVIHGIHEVPILPVVQAVPRGARLALSPTALGGEVHWTWQNGRIERFFGTLKDKLDRWAVADGLALQASLRVFRLWYNHVRAHQHLGGRMPIEAWNNTDIRHRPKRLVWFEGWDGLLQGEYLQR